MAGLNGADEPTNQTEETLPPVTDASASDAELDARIDEIASGQFGMDLNAERFRTAGSNDENSDDPQANGKPESQGDPDDGQDPGAETDQGADPGLEPGEGGDNGDDAAGITPPRDPDQPKAQPTVDPANPTQPERVVAPPDDKVYEVKATDADGKEHTFSSFDDLPDDFRPASNKEAMRIMYELGQLDQVRAADDALRARAREQEAAITAETERQQATIAQWDREIDALITAGDIPRPAVKPGEAGADKDPGIKIMDDVFSFMQQENAKRAEAGTPRLSSFRDAFELKSARDTAARAKTEADAAKTRVRQKAANVARSGARSAAAPSVYRAGQASDISDLLK